MIVRKYFIMHLCYKKKKNQKNYNNINKNKYNKNNNINAKIIHTV